MGYCFNTLRNKSDKSGEHHSPWSAPHLVSALVLCLILYLSFNFASQSPAPVQVTKKSGSKISLRLRKAILVHSNYIPHTFNSVVVLFLYQPDLYWVLLIFVTHLVQCSCWLKHKWSSWSTTWTNVAIYYALWSHSIPFSGWDYLYTVSLIPGLSFSLGMSMHKYIY